MLGRVERDGDHRRNFERTGDGDYVVASLGLFQGGRRTAQQLVRDIVVEASLDDKNPPLGGQGTRRRAAGGERPWEPSNGMVRLEAPSVALLTRLRKARGVAGHLVDLDVDAPSCLHRAPGRYLQRVRNEEHGEEIPVH